MKLYVWQNFEPDASPGIAFALAESEDEAKKAITASYIKDWIIEWGDLSIHDIDVPISFYLFGGG